jgi:hypothetical protein
VGWYRRKVNSHLAIYKYLSKKKDMELSLSEQEKELHELWAEMILMKVENRLFDMLAHHYPQPKPRVSSLEEVLASHIFWDGEK